MSDEEGRLVLKMEEALQSPRSSFTSASRFPIPCNGLVPLQAVRKTMHDKAKCDACGGRLSATRQDRWVLIVALRRLAGRLVPGAGLVVHPQCESKLKERGLTQQPDGVWTYG